MWLMNGGLLVLRCVNLAYAREHRSTIEVIPPRPCPEHSALFGVFVKACDPLERGEGEAVVAALRGEKKMY